MRESISGIFFAKNNSELEIPSTLEIYEDGDFLLKSDKAFSDDNSIDEDYILGQDAEGNRVSILGAKYKEKTTVSIGKPKQSKIIGSMVFIGKNHITDPDALLIKEFKINIECDAWFYEDRYHEDQGQLVPTKKKVNLKYDETTNITIISSHCLSSGKHKSTVTFSSESEKNLRYFQNSIHHLVTFLSFATRSITKHSEYTFKDSNLNEFKLLYKPSFYRNHKEPTNKILFNYKSTNLQEKFLRWIETYDKASAIFKLYFLPELSKLDLIVKLLVETQALECFSRKLNGNNDLTFIERIREVTNNGAYYSKLLDISDAATLSNLELLIRDTRNYYTHYNDTKYDNKISDEELIFLVMKIELLIDLFLLEKIGFTAVEFEEIKKCVIDDRFNRQQHLMKFLR